MANEDVLRTVLFAVRVAFPAILLATSLSLFNVKNSTRLSSDSPIVSVVVAVTTPRRSLILSTLSLVALTYFLNGFGLVLHSVLTKKWQGTPGQGHWWYSQWSGLEVEAVAGLLASGLLAILGVWKESQGATVWTMRRPKFWTAVAVIGTIVEISLIFTTAHFYRRGVGIPENPPSYKFADLLHALFPILRLLVLLPLYAALAKPRVSYVPASDAGRAEADAVSVAASEDTGLLHSLEDANLTAQGLNAHRQSQYGTFRSGRSFATSTRSHTPVPSDAQEATPFLKKPSPTVRSENPKPEQLGFKDMCRRLKRLTPYLWPKGSIKLQSLATLCVLVLLVARVVNVAVPLVLGALVDLFEKLYGSSTPQPDTQSFWPYLLTYVTLRFLQGSGGLSALREFLWAPVTQYSDREMSQMTFSHLLSLSLSFHLRRKTGEILRILDRGAAINRIFELLLFNISPVFIDMFVAIGVFSWKFDWVLAVLVAFVMFAYVGASIGLTTWRTQIRRQMNDKDIITRGIHTDCLLNYETVKYFGGEAFETERYASAIRDYQSLEYRVIASLNLLNLVQNLLMSIGFLVGGIIVALRVSHRVSTPSEFVVFIVYLGQLYGPLNRLGSVYRQINTSLVDAERLMKLLDEPTEVTDKPGAPDLIVNDGEIEFDNVSFSYDGRRTALRGVSFKVPKGSSVALVGESGSGKSTVLRLLYRFYDLKEGEGRILIDGQDIRDVTQLSLRKAIGVVPQDSVLFNASIAYNIGYGKFGASQDEIEAAASAAHMHERVMSFPDGYDTKVGERGVRLSGGEKQRVAIARTLLKNPPVLLLDEATSALDTSTEKDIQKALSNLMHGRSSLSIAHRLSTIASADLILVLKDGQIVEQGTHRELLDRDGIFAAMWADQIRAEEPELVSLGVSKQEVGGYSVQPDVADSQPPADGVAEPVHEQVPEPVTQTEETVQESTIPDAGEVGTKNDTAEAIPADMPLTAADADRDDAAAPSAPPAGPVASSSDAPVAFPSEEPVAFPSEEPVAFPSAPVSFPTSEQSPEPDPAAVPSSAGVTFDDTVSHPSRSETPDAGDPRRKRTASQNFQRFARRVSLVGRRTASGINTGPSAQPTTLSKEEGKPVQALRDMSVSADDASGRAEESASASPAASLAEGKKLPRKEKLKKRFSMGGGKKDSA